MPHTKEEALRLGIKIQPIKHSMKSRAVWHDYTRKGTYLLTIHINMDDEGRCYEGMLLSHIVGDPMAACGTEAYPRPDLTDLGRLVDYKIDATSSYPQFRDVEVKARTITAKAHPSNSDRSYCGKGIMLVLGPWVIEDASLPLTDGNRNIPSDSLYAKFHNLNAMAAELCREIVKISIDKKTLEECAM